MILPKTYSAKVVRNLAITPNVIELVLKVDSGDFTFIPGQFIYMDIPGTDPLLKRAYSIASAECDLPVLKLWIKFSDGSATEAPLRSLTVGAPITFKGPYGSFQFHPTGRPALFVATSTGLAPFASILDSISDPTLKQLLFGCRSEADLFALDLLERLKREKRIAVSTTLSKGSANWNGLHGRVTQAIANFPKDLTQWDHYLCGSPPMVEDVRSTLIEKGVQTKHIYFEKYLAI